MVTKPSKGEVSFHYWVNNMEEALTKELAKKLMELKGEVRGASIKDNWSAILYDRGERALKELEDKMAEVGYPLKYKEIKSTSFYPIGYDAVSVLAIKEVFNLSDKELEELGASGVRFSLFFKVLLRYFGSLRLIAPQTTKMWRKYYTIGNLKVTEVNEKERYVILRLKDFAINRTFCFTIRGYCAKVLSMLVKSPAFCQETKCVHKGDKYHEFLIKW